MNAFQRVETAVLPDTNGLYVRNDDDDDDDGDDDECAPVTVSARVRHIITRNLATPDAEQEEDQEEDNGLTDSATAVLPSVEQLMEENSVMKVGSCVLEFSRPIANKRLAFFIHLFAFIFAIVHVAFK